MIPENLAEHIADEGYGKVEAVKMAFANPEDTAGNLVRLGMFWRIDVVFDRSVEVRSSKYKVKRGDRHTFAGFFESKEHGICYAIRRPLRSGYYFGTYLPMVVAYRLVDPGTVSGREDKFRDFEAFAKKFDRRFITEDEVRVLWATKSPQHGGQFKPSDFHAIGPKGRRVVKRFLEQYAGLDAPEPGNGCYRPGFEGNGYILHVEEHADSHTGRDITIEHKVGKPYVHYSSELPGCGNGRYGLLATEKTFLWVEDD